VSWNYRLVQRRDGFFSVNEVYYNAAGEALGMTDAKSVGPFEEASEVIETLKMMSADIEKNMVFVEPEKGGWAESDWPSAETSPAENDVKGAE
jgi:hypothetical protein